MEQEMISVISELLPLITAGGTVLSAAGLVPRIGPGRAAWIEFRSRFAFKPRHESLRVDEIKVLRSRIVEPVGQGYLVITGEAGVGKTCLLDTVTSKTAGVINVNALPSQNADTIITNALHKLTGLPFHLIPPFGSAARVIFWHRIYTGGMSPIVVINAAQDNVDLTAGVRTLVDDHKLRVVVYGSPNSLDESLMRTKRQHVFEIKPVTKDMVWKISQFQPLFEYVKQADDYGALW
jgi:hypothetical protein